MERHYKEVKDKWIGFGGGLKKGMIGSGRPVPLENSRGIAKLSGSASFFPVPPMSDTSFSPNPQMREFRCRNSRWRRSSPRSAGSSPRTVWPMWCERRRIGAAFELTEAIAADGRCAGSHRSARRRRPVIARHGDGPRAGLGEPASRLDPRAAAPRAGAGPRPSRLFCRRRAGAAATAFARLGAVPRERRAEADQTSEPASARSKKSFASIRGRCCRPGPPPPSSGIVERLVGEEIGRIVGEAGLR